MFEPEKNTLHIKMDFLSKAIVNFMNMKAVKAYFERTGSILYIDLIPTVLEQDGFKDKNGLGVQSIEIGDKFEGWSCGNYFSNQVCTGVNGGMVYGTTTLAVFDKDNIKIVGSKAFFLP